MQDKSIDNALLALRKNLIRTGGAGLEHVEALLALRGVAMPVVSPINRVDAASPGHMQRVVIAALRDGGLTMPDLTRKVLLRRPELDWTSAYQRTGQCLARLKQAGRVDRNGRVWALPARNLPR